jgi:hypothetical protein
MKTKDLIRVVQNHDICLEKTSVGIKLTCKENVDTCTGSHCPYEPSYQGCCTYLRNANFINHTQEDEFIKEISETHPELLI